MSVLRPLACVLALTAALGACSDDGANVRSGSGSGSGSHGSGSHGSGPGAANCPTALPSGATTVDVALREYEVAPSASTAPAGRIAFRAKNDGKEQHELVVVRADGPDLLPTKNVSDPVENGRVDEEAIPTGDLIGEIAPFGKGATCVGSFPLTPGRYVLLCNISEKHGEEIHNHYQRGMRTLFTVT